MTKTATKIQTESGNNIAGEKLITRIKLMPGNTLEVNYKLANDKEALEVSYTGKEEVTDRYLEQFAKLNAPACQIVPILEYAYPADLKAGVLRLKYNEKGNLDKMSVSVQLKLTTSNSPVNISTPMVDFVTEDSPEEAFRISAENEEIVHELLAMTKAYMNGETRTKQLSLVVDNEE